MGKQLDLKGLLSKTPYKGYRLPGTMEEEENRLAEAVDPDLRPEDHGMVLRYLHYADTLLNSPEGERSGSFLLRPTLEKPTLEKQERESREEPVTASPEQDDSRAA
jgi:hypothetical protein